MSRDRDRNSVSSDDTDAFDEQIWAWIDGELSALESRAVEARVAADPALAERVAAIRLADEALRALPAPPPREGLQRALWQRVEAQQRELARARWSRRALLWAAPAAAAALAILWLRTERTPTPGAGRVAPSPVSEFAVRESRVQEPEFATATEPEPEEAVLPAPSASAPTESVLPAPRALAAQEPIAPRPVPSAEPDLPQAAPSAGEAPALELSDEELVLAVELEMLEDLAVIENLELLESLALPEPELEEEG